MNIKKIEKAIAKNKRIGIKLEYYKNIDSTHIYGKEIGEKSENNGKVLIAEEQTKGIGTQGRKWYTGKGKNIAITIILQPKCKVKQLDGLTIKIAKSIQEAIYEMYGYKLEIKKPNDLMLNNKKICGILTEIHTMGEKIKFLLISFGFNVNENNFSDQTKEIATSLKREFNKEFSREDIIIKIIEKLEEIEI